MQPTDTAALVVAVPELGLAKPEPTSQNPAAVYLARLAPGSRRTMRQALNTIAGVLTSGQLDATAIPWPTLRYEHTQAVRAALCERYAPATANKMLSALRGVLKEAWRLGQLDAETYQRAADLAPARGSRLPAGRALGEGEVRALAADCADGSPAGARDAAALALLAAGGLRRAELVALDVADVDTASGEVRVHGKGDKERLIHLANGGLCAVAAWLEVRGSEAGPLLCPINKGGRIELRRMTTQAVYGIVKRRAEAAGVTAPTPHDFRRTFASQLLDAGADISAVQRLMGHANTSTTARYDRRGEAAKRAAASKIHFPYVAPEKVCRMGGGHRSLEGKGKR